MAHVGIKGSRHFKENAQLLLYQSTQGAYKRRLTCKIGLPIDGPIRLHIGSPAKGEVKIFWHISIMKDKTFHLEIKFTFFLSSIGEARYDVFKRVKETVCFLWHKKKGIDGTKRYGCFAQKPAPFSQIGKLGRSAFNYLSAHMQHIEYLIFSRIQSFSKT